MDNPNPNAICGHCGRPFSDHDQGDQIYCFDNTNGDLWSDEPHDEAIGALLNRDQPSIYAVLVAQWKRENGHTNE